MKIFFLAIILIGIAITGIAIKMFLIKGSEFKKSCSSIDPKTGKKIGCVCKESGKEGECQNK
ncbi:MAG: hypothetical protein A2X12_04790 [Bacteroidetes bacterium GWE2_29_8]|nr:MAG: hypothetical protein A2X12_04790 [Bacteroidetes bacterium GWE2_29_8]OFY13805.1 MAG: hypothetical protein A2X02_10090 [Bacteroidetes bacterium GWF2_29_10]